MKLFLVLLSLSSFAYAHNNDVTHRPQSFTYGSERVVFVDFEEAHYDINYDIDKKQASVEASIRLNVVEEGQPVFDLLEDPNSVKIDGQAVSTKTISTPQGETKLRMIEKRLPKGVYNLQINVPLENLVDFTNGGVKNAFWVTDLQDRFYLERYIPVNLEYDRVKMIFNVNFKGLKVPQHVFANGNVTWKNAQQARIEFPEYFTVNSLYYHTTPVGSVELMQTKLKSIDGRELPLTIYQNVSVSSGKNLERFKELTETIVAELEGDYGPFPHESITIYNASLAHMGLGGMEYAGATVTNYRSLGHELFHSYFARAVSPANGNAGWIDEALASWRDDGYQRRNTFSGSSSMASRAYYTRKTDTAAYSFGSRFMSYLDGMFAEQGGLKPFMNQLLQDRIFKPLFTEDFIGDMEKFYGKELTEVFKKHVYGNKQMSEKGLKNLHPIHKKMGEKELKLIL